MYTIINKNYLGLSREMEFHADAVAASVSGGNNLVGALSRIEVAGNSYQTAIENANDLLKEKKIVKNIFRNQLVVFRSIGKEYQLPVHNGLPEITYQFIQSFSSSRINYKNQWASHPTLEERKQKLDQLHTAVNPDEASAWEIFDHPELLQETVTSKLYHAIENDLPSQVYEAAEFEKWYLDKKEHYTLPSIYKGYYDNRYISIQDWNFDDVINTPITGNAGDFFSDKNIQLPLSIKSNENDITLLKAILEKQLDVKSFDFDGIKHKSEDSAAVIKQVEDEIAGQKKDLEKLDREIFAYCYQHSGEKENMKSCFISYRAISEQYEKYVKPANLIMNTLEPFYSSKVTIEQVSAGISTLRDHYEKQLKRQFSECIDNGYFNDNPELIEALRKFIPKKYYYFFDNQFRNEELEELTNLTIKTANALSESKYKCYKQFLVQQLTGF